MSDVEQPDPTVKDRTRYGDYEVGCILGMGATGMVFAAKHVDSSNHVALKLIRPHLQQHPAAKEIHEAFHEHGSTVRQYDHPNLISIRDTGNFDDGTPYLVMEQLVAVKPLGAADAAKLIATVARALHYLHAQQVVHGDVKPSNLMFRQGRTEPEQVILTGHALGVLYARDPDLLQKGRFSTAPEYGAPETRSTPPVLSPRADIFSLGAILFELLSGEKPKAKAESPDLSKLRPALARICTTCLAPNPEDRYDSAAKLAEDLDRSFS